MKTLLLLLFLFPLFAHAQTSFSPSDGCWDYRISLTDTEPINYLERQKRFIATPGPDLLWVPTEIEWDHPYNPAYTPHCGSYCRIADETGEYRNYPCVKAGRVAWEVVEVLPTLEPLEAWTGVVMDEREKP